MSPQKPLVQLALKGDSVHDIRVALKRMRVLVSLFLRYQNSSFKNILEELKICGKNLCPARDTQVLESLWQHYIQSLNLPSRPQTDNPKNILKKNPESKILEALLSLQKSAHRLRYDLSFNWKKYGHREARRLLQRIDQKYQKLKKQENAVLFHKLRKNIKNLGYLGEFGWLSDRSQKTKAQIKKLGKKLGHLHDLYLFLEKLPDFSSRTDTETLLKIEKLARKDLKKRIRQNLSATQKLLGLQLQ